MGVRQHAWANKPVIGANGLQERGPGGHCLWTCVKCGCQQTFVKQRAHYRRDASEPWVRGPYGCDPTKKAGG